MTKPPYVAVFLTLRQAESVTRALEVYTAKRAPSHPSHGALRVLRQVLAR